MTRRHLKHADPGKRPKKNAPESHDEEHPEGASVAPPPQETKKEKTGHETKKGRDPAGATKASPRLETEQERNTLGPREEGKESVNAMTEPPFQETQHDKNDTRLQVEATDGSAPQEEKTEATPTDESNPICAVTALPTQAQSRNTSPIKIGNDDENMDGQDIATGAKELEEPENHMNATTDLQTDGAPDLSPGNLSKSLSNMSLDEVGPDPQILLQPSALREQREQDAARKRPIRRRNRPARRTDGLPQSNPEDFTHRFIQNHPLAEFFNPRPANRLAGLREADISSELPFEKYPRVTSDTYQKPRSVRRLFPQAEPQQLTIFDVPGIQEAIVLRNHAAWIRHTLFNNPEEYREVFDPNEFPTEEARHFPCCKLPPTYENQRPVLYQVLSKNDGKNLVLECKDLFVIYPDFPELQYITLDVFSVNIISKKRGFDRTIVSCKDFVWIYDVEATRHARQDPHATFESAKSPRLSVLDNKAKQAYRASRFAFVTPHVREEKKLGFIVKGRKGADGNPRTPFQAAFEGSPDCVTITQSLCQGFEIKDTVTHDPLMADMRVNVSTAARFSEPPSSMDSVKALTNIVAGFCPGYPDEGLLPLRVYAADKNIRDWIDDRITDFESFRQNRERNVPRIGKAFNASCSAIAAARHYEEDRKPHETAMLVQSPPTYPLRATFRLESMVKEAGWANSRTAQIWFKGTRTSIYAPIETVRADVNRRTLDVTIRLQGAKYNTVVPLMDAFGTRVSETEVKLDIATRLCRMHVAADPLYEIVSRDRLLTNIIPGSRTDQLMTTLYGLKRQDEVANAATARPPQESETLPQSLSIRGTPVTLTLDQQEAVRIGMNNRLIAAIQAPYGTGKTLIGSIISNEECRRNGKVILTATTNNAVARLAEAVLTIDNSDMKPLRYVSDAALQKEGAPSTEVDIKEKLVRLSETYADEMEPADYQVAFRYRNAVTRMKDIMLDRKDIEDDSEREEYMMAETDVSELTRRMIELLEDHYDFNVLAITTAALLNSTGHEGIFEDIKDIFTYVIIDEASQAPEPVLLALANRFPTAKFLLIGDVRQLQPHCPIDSSAFAAQLGARGAMDLAVRSGTPLAALRSTFRQHPALTELANEVFYNGELRGAAEVLDRTELIRLLPELSMVAPMIFVDVVGSEVVAANRSRYNLEEAEACRRAAVRLGRLGLDLSKCAIICFYKQQARKLQEFGSQMNLEVLTVDSCQGREFDVTFLLTTRSSSTAETAFIEEPHRANVALSRCKHGQLLFGSRKLLETKPIWGPTLAFIDRRGAVVPATYFD